MNKQKIILYSAWKFIPDKKFIDAMNRFGYEGKEYNNLDLRLDSRMIKFIEDNAIKKYEWEKIPQYLSTKCDTKGKAGVVHTSAWIGEVDLDRKFTIINGSVPFIGAEGIKQFDIKEFDHNYVEISGAMLL